MREDSHEAFVALVVIARAAYIADDGDLYRITRKSLLDRFGAKIQFTRKTKQQHDSGHSQNIF